MKNQPITSAAYEIIENRPVADLNSQGLVLKHKKTGARVMILANEDENKVFYIAFRTPPTDSTGVAHILEHSVLCGSAKFPAKDPFIELAKGSLNTFLNAMTYPDKTVYPIASCNDKDFANLMDVYLDAVFFPNIYKEEKIFMQEGWHYELDGPDGELTVNGVVYNEMKGAFSTPDDVVEREICATLFPGTTYGFESGGEPDCIPTLTYEEFLDFHRKYYHPSNSYIYLYGNMDVEERLAFIDEQYLSRFTAQPIDSSIPPVPPFTAPQLLEKEYPVMEGEDMTDGAYLAYNVSLGAGVDAQKYIAFQILEYALCIAPGAPLKQKLLDRRIGKEVYSVMEVGIGQPYFSVIAKDTAPEKQDEFIRTVETILEEQADRGMDVRTLAAALNYYEFRYREADFGSHPKGLIMGLQAMDSWLYDDGAVFTHIEANATFTALKQAIGTGYYEDLIRRYLIDNPHKSILRVVPVPNLTAQKEARLAEEMQVYKSTLPAAAIEELIKRAEDLARYQDEPSSPADLASIPMLTRADIKKEAADYVNEERRSGRTTILFHDIFTNGIGYLRFIFDIKKVPEELFPYIGILKTALCLVDTAHFSYAELNNEINIETGGFHTAVNTYMNANDCAQYKATLEVKVKVLDHNRHRAFALAGEIVRHSCYQDSKRLYEIIAELKSKTETAMAGAGHSLAAIRSLSYLSEPAAVSEQINGIPQYRLLCELEAHFEEKKAEITHKLELLASYIFREDNLMIDYTASAEGYAGIEELVQEFAKGLFTTPIDDANFVCRPQKRNEGFMTAGQVQYVARAGNFIKKGLPYTGALKVLKVMMGYEYLWIQVRVKGGAYGCMCSFTKSGDSYFVSYRDPNLRKTVEIYRQAAEFIKNYQGDARAITQFVIGAISDMDIPMTPAAKGAYSLSGYMTGLSFAALQKERDEVLAATQEDIRALSRYVEAFMADECLCVVGNEDKIRECKDLFMEIVPLFQ